jgi:hypothetical protein
MENALTQTHCPFSSVMGDADTVNSDDQAHLATFLVPMPSLHYPQDYGYDLGLLVSSPMSTSSSDLFSSICHHESDEESERDYMSTSRHFVDITLQNFVKPESLGARVSSTTKPFTGYGAWTSPRTVQRRPRAHEPDSRKSKSLNPQTLVTHHTMIDHQPIDAEKVGAYGRQVFEKYEHKHIPPTMDIADVRAGLCGQRAHGSLPQSLLQVSLKDSEANRRHISELVASQARACRKAAIGRLRFKKASRRFGRTRTIRYQSRKRIAEVRPRVHGRFVRLANDVAVGSQ